MANVMAVVQYDGAAYHGFQIQAGHPTIQGELEAALAHITQERMRIVGAGRTDSGVHARAQVISFQTGWAHAWDTLQRACNAVLPAAIALQSLQVAPAGFHARRSAQARTYRYTINNRPIRSPLTDRYAWAVPLPLAADLMHTALQSLLGEHDFSAFGNPPQKDNSAVRTLYMARCWREVDTVVCELTANAFLQGMVRQIVGALVEVGAGRLTVDAFAALLPARDKNRLKWKAEPHGLCLWSVAYDDQKTSEVSESVA